MRPLLFREIKDNKKSDEFEGGEVLEAYYEDDGSARWFDIGTRNGPKVRFNMTAVEFGMVMQQFGDLASQVRAAQEQAISTHAMSALHSFGETANSTIGGSHVAIKFQVTKDGSEQAFAVPPDRAIWLADLIKAIMFGVVVN